MASASDTTNDVTNSSERSDQGGMTEIIKKEEEVDQTDYEPSPYGDQKNEPNPYGDPKTEPNPYGDLENDPNLTYSFTDNNNPDCTITEKSSSSSSFENTYDRNDDKSGDRKETNDISTDSDSFAIIENDDTNITPSTSTSSITKKTPKRKKGKSLSFDPNHGLDENIVKLICQTVEMTLKTYLSKYNFKKNKNKSRNRNRKKMSDRKKNIKDTSKNDTTVTTHHNNIFLRQKPAPFNLKTDIFGIKNDMMEVTQNGNAPTRLSPQSISDIVDNALNGGHKNNSNNDKPRLQFNDGQGSSYNNDKGNPEKSSDDNLNLNNNSFTPFRGPENQSTIIGQVPLIANQPPWWFRDNILMATEFLNKGTSSVKFHHCYFEEENKKTKLYETAKTQSLTCMSQYENKSFEELRYEDYILQEIGAYIRHKINPIDFRSSTATIGDTSQHMLIYAPTFAQEEYIKKNGEIERVQVKYHCISCMKDCKNLSFEELRLDYYIKNITKLGIIKARPHEVTASHSLDRALGETALKNYKRLEEKSPKPVASNESTPSTSKDCATQNSIFKQSIFNDSETIAKSIFTKSNNPFFNPFTHCRLPEFRLDTEKFDNEPKNSTEKSFFDVTPAKINFVFNPNAPTVKKASPKPKSNLQSSKESQIISKSSDTSTLMFGWSCKPYSFSKPAEPILNFNKTNEEPKLAKTSNIFGAKPKNVGGLFSNDVVRATIDKLLNDKNGEMDEDCVMNDTTDLSPNTSASTSAMDSTDIEKQTNTVFKETSQLLHNIEVLTSQNKSENAKIAQYESKAEEKMPKTSDMTKSPCEMVHNIKVLASQNESEIVKIAQPVSKADEKMQKTRDMIKRACEKARFKLNSNTCASNGRRVFAKSQSNSPKQYFTPDGSKNLFSSLPSKDDTKSASTFSLSNTKDYKNNEVNQTIPAKFNFFKTTPVSSLLNNAKPSTSAFSFDINKDKNNDKRNDTKPESSSPSTSIFGVDNSNINNPFLIKRSELFNSKDLNNFATKTSKSELNTNNSNPITFDFKGKLGSPPFGQNRSEFNMSSPIDIQHSKPFLFLNNSTVDNNIQNKQFSKENKSIEGSSIFNQEKRPAFEFNKPFAGEQYFTNRNLPSNSGSNSKTTDTNSIFRSYTLSILNSSPNEIVSPNTLASSSELTATSANGNTSIIQTHIFPALPNCSNNEPKTRPWKSFFAFKPFSSRCNSNPAHDDNISTTELGSTLINTPELNVAHRFPNCSPASLAILALGTGSNTSSINNNATPNNVTLNRSVLMPNESMQSPIVSQNATETPLPIPYKFTNIDPSFANRVFNCIDESKVSQVRNTLDNVIPNLTDDSSEDDEVLETRDSSRRRRNTSCISIFDNSDEESEPVATNMVNEMTYNRSFNSSSNVLGLARFNSSNAFDANISPIENISEERRRNGSTISIFDNSDEEYEPVATNNDNEMTDNRPLNSSGNGWDLVDSAFDALLNPDSGNGNNKNDNKDYPKGFKPLKVIRFNCTGRNQEDNDIDDDHAKYIFGETTVKCGLNIELLLKNLNQSPKLYVGLTTCNPKNLTDFEMPYQPGDLCERTESWSIKDVTLTLTNMKKITLHFENQGEVNIICNHKTTQQLFVDYSVSTWPFFVIHGGHVEIDILTDDNQDGVVRSPVDINKSDCVICYENPVDTVLYKCGHSCLCLKCGKLMLRNQGICPICRDIIRDVIKIYTS